MKRLSDLSREQREWINQFERINSHTIHGDNWKKFMMDEVTWDEFMRQELSDYANAIQDNMNYLANLHYSLEKQEDETDVI